MRRDDSVFCIGENIGVYGGAFKVTEGLLADSISCGFGQIVNFAAKTRYRWGASVPIVVGPAGEHRRRAVPVAESGDVVRTHTGLEGDRTGHRA